MSRLLARKTPGHFKTLPLYVEATADSLHYRSLGYPLNFEQMLARRRPVQVMDNQRFALELANLGVSVDLTLAWQGRDFKVLVRQQRPDRGDAVLKMISGYVPAHELNLPLLTAIQEVAEECLIETESGWLSGRYADTWLPTPYPRLHYREDQHFRLAPQSGAAYPVQCGNLILIERPRAYVHLPTASLQLVYDLRLELPRDCREPSLYHVDERIEDTHLVARLERRRPGLYLLPLNAKRTDQLFTLRNGELIPAPTRGVWLSEGFASQKGWLIEDERIRWKDWLSRGPAAQPHHTRTVQHPLYSQIA